MNDYKSVVGLDVGLTTGWAILDTYQELPGYIVSGVATPDTIQETLENIHYSTPVLWVVEYPVLNRVNPYYAALVHVYDQVAAFLQDKHPLVVTPGVWKNTPVVLWEPNLNPDIDKKHVKHIKDAARIAKWGLTSTKLIL